jgi:hypothetical protein
MADESAFGNGVGTGALIQLGANVLPRIIGQGARNKKLAAAGKTFKTPQGYGDAVNIAKGIANSGDPNFSNNLQAIYGGEANQVSRAKSLTGNANDILSVLQGANKTATDSALSASAQDSNFRINAKKYLAQTTMAQGGADAQTQRANYQAQQAELGRQQQNLNMWAQAGGNIANDVVSSKMMNQYYGGQQKTQGGSPTWFQAQAMRKKYGYTDPRTLDTIDSESVG